MLHSLQLNTLERFPFIILFFTGVGAHEKMKEKMRKISFVYLRKINAALYLSQLVLGTIHVFHLCLKV